MNVGETDSRKADADTKVGTKRQTCIQRNNKETEHGKKRGDRDTNKGLNEGKAGPREREEDRKSPLRNHPSPRASWVWPHPAPPPLPASLYPGYL